MTHAIFDTEIIGKHAPVFLIGVRILETGEAHSFWLHKRGHLKRFAAMLPLHTWVGFNSENFDRPLIAAALMGYEADAIKQLAEAIINEEKRSWQTYQDYDLDFVEYDHIDLQEVAPGVMISLKTYAGRMGYPTMMDMPFAHDHDLTPRELKIVERYCHNDIGVTARLFEQLHDEIELRKELTATYALDLRSKSDAQIAEAILKTRCGIGYKDKQVPGYVTYTAPDFIRTDHPGITELINLLNEHRFKINHANGSPEAPEFLAEPLRINNGFYQCGIGGLHSTHDQQMYLEATDTLCLSDFDVASYYPNIMMKAGLLPRLGGNKGELFLAEYRRIYEQRMEAKRAGNKKVANSLKITLNGTFGKLGNIYCSFYSPDLMLAVTITGQLNLLCLIHELEKIKGVSIRSANTDGVLVAYPPAKREQVLKVFARNSKRTGFEYEETPYRKYAAKDVNNYIAVKTNGVKGKGLYAEMGLQKNPTMQVCVNAAIAFLQHGTALEETIRADKDIRNFVAVRNVKGGGIQYDRYATVDDWEEIAPRLWAYPGMTRKPEKRKSRPAPRQVGQGGKPFGRVARWYMTTQTLPPLSYLGSGNTVPKTEGARICLTLPDQLPKDLDYAWYLAEAQAILDACGL